NGLGRLFANLIRRPERVLVAVDVDDRVLEHHRSVSRKQAGDMIRVHVSDHNGVDCVWVNTCGGEILWQAAQRGEEYVRCSGVDEYQFFAGVDEPFVDRSRDAHFGQECGLKQFFCARLVSTEQCGLEREITVAEHRDFKGADLMTVDAGSLHACKWRSHAPSVTVESENPARCLVLVLATLNRPRFPGNTVHQCSRCNVRFWQILLKKSVEGRRFS